nr:MAG: ORF1 [Torque teno midi virus]
MPFWWRRRRKPWYTPWGQRRYRRRRYRRKARRPYRRRRRRNRKTTRRRRRKLPKVRRKKKFLKLVQWQPDRIRKCTIKGRGTLVMGAHGRQMICFTNVKDRLTPSRAPAGGGFGIERFTLSHLYEEWKSRNNIWTATNENTDLGRYLGCQFTFYRHPDTDFILKYERQGPFNLEKYSYMYMQPQELLLGRHKRILLSKQTNPKGRLKLKLKIGPPKLLTNKWLLQSELAKQDLVQISGAAASFRYPTIGCCNENRVLNLYSINIEFFKEPHWMQTQSGPNYYKPYSTIPPDLKFYYKTQSGTESSIQGPTSKDKALTIDYGWFQPKILGAFKVTKGDTSTQYGELPMVLLRYNPAADQGPGNLVTIIDLVAGQWQGPYPDDYTIKDVPLWLALTGYANYVIQKSGDKGIMKHKIICVKSSALYRLPTVSTQKIFPLIGAKFVNAKPPYDQPLTPEMQKNWYPTYEHQQEPLNDIVCCGPLVPKFYNQTNSTWELQYFYRFYFKWGGPEIGDPTVDDPKTKGQKATDYTMPRTIQISNPLKNKTESILHPWDFRRGIVTKRALERMCQNLETDSDLYPDGETPKKKKKTTCELRNPEEEIKEVQSCILSLCQTETSEEEDPNNLQQLILKQKLKQQQLKHNILVLLTDLKTKQNSLRLQTGNLE